MLSAPKGTHDLLPEALATWHFVEDQVRTFLSAASFSEIRTPIFESTELFERGVGESTDIVNKEMYTFEKGERSLTLRPENTAGVVRAYIQNGMDRWPKPVKLYYVGPMFRYERPQAGRQRQFHQLGMEVFGLDTPATDAYVIMLAHDLLDTLGLKGLSLEINNVGCFDCREAFKTKFRELVRPYLSELCEDCQKRFETNPLRMLDCKNPTCKAVYARPEIAAFLAQDNTCEACQAHFKGVLGILGPLGIPFQINKMLVRGLDYYTKTVFEITSTNLGSQNAVCGGGRYNGLVKQMGGPDTPGIGWAMGMERLISLLPSRKQGDVEYFIISDDPAEALKISRILQKKGKSVAMDLTGKSIGKLLGQASKLNASFAIILGESERQNNMVKLKYLNSTQEDLMPFAEFEKLFPN